MRSFPIFFACVRTWRYRDSRAATPTVRRSAKPAPCIDACDRPPHCASGCLPAASLARRSTLYAELATQRLDRNAVDEGTLAVDLENGEPLAVRLLQRRVVGDVHLVVEDALTDEKFARELAEVAASAHVEDDASTYRRHRPPAPRPCRGAL